MTSTRSIRLAIAPVLFCCFAGGSTLFAAGSDVLRINGDKAKTLLGDGTNIVVGVVDSGIDDQHPSLLGTDSLGRPRMVAEANFVTTEPSNTGDDVFGHGTAVMGVIGLRSASFLTIATDSRYINARALDSNNSFNSDAWVVNATGFAVSNGANLLNLSLGYFNAATNGSSRLSLMADYITYNRRIPIAISAGNAGNNANRLPQGPGDAYNVFSLGATGPSGFGRITTFSSYGPTTDNRSKPDLAAPGESILTANDDWEFGSLHNNWSGTSFAAPNTAGMLAAQMEAASRWGYSRDPLVLKATMYNAAEKVQRRDGSAWSQVSSSAGGVTTVTTPIDRDSGAGQINGLALYHQYVPGDLAPTAAATDPVGWNFNTITSASTRDYHLGVLAPNSPLAATLAWYRKTGYTDVNSNGVIDSSDSFSQLSTLANLSLELYRNGTLVAQSTSSVDNVEHLFLQNLPGGSYSLKVRSASAASDEFALAWSAQTLPGDFNSDGSVNAADIDLLLFGIEGDLPTARPRFDLTGDYTVENDPNAVGSDADRWVRTLKLTEYGDITLDQVVNFDDLLVLAQHYGTATGAGWANGSFDGNGAVSFDDLLLLAQHYGFGSLTLRPSDFAADWTLARSLVPEPGILASLAALALALRTRPRSNRSAAVG